MGRLVIDGNSVYEIDEECVKKNHPPKECGIYEHLDTDQHGKRDRSGNTGSQSRNAYRHR